MRLFQRWGFEQSEAALLGALRGPQPVSRELARAIEGDATPEAAAREARAAVQRLRASSG